MASTCEDRIDASTCEDQACIGSAGYTFALRVTSKLNALSFVSAPLSNHCKNDFYSFANRLYFFSYQVPKRRRFQIVKMSSKAVTTAPITRAITGVMPPLKTGAVIDYDFLRDVIKPTAAFRVESKISKQLAEDQSMIKKSDKIREREAVRNDFFLTVKNNPSDWKTNSLQGVLRKRNVLKSFLCINEYPELINGTFAESIKPLNDDGCSQLLETFIENKRRRVEKDASY